MLSEVLQATGDTAQAGRVMVQARDIAKGVKLNDLLGQLELAAPQPAQNSLLGAPSDTQLKTTVPATRRP